MYSQDDHFDLAVLDGCQYPQHPQYAQEQYFHQQKYQLQHGYDHYDPVPLHSRQLPCPSPDEPLLSSPLPHPHSIIHSAPAAYNTNPFTASSSSFSYSFPPLADAETYVEPSKCITTSAAPRQKRRRSDAPPLLSQSQKKANHVQSEQKRRTNIRRGCEALCGVVPALADAIQYENSLIATISTPYPGNGMRSCDRGRDDGAQKVGVRAKLPSECVVLNKTVDYITELLAERQSLLRRLDLARSILPLGHPARVSAHSHPSWEREWMAASTHDDPDDEDD